MKSYLDILIVKEILEELTDVSNLEFSSTPIQVFDSFDI